MGMEKSAILFYAFGSGLGHLTRASSIARKLSHLVSGDLAVLTNTPFHDLFGEIPVRFIDTRSGSTACARDLIGEVIRRNTPRALIIDSFPRGIAGELPPILSRSDCKKILVRRILKDDYVQKFGINQFVIDHYNTTIYAEPVAQPHPPGALCCPILIRDFAELPSRAVSRSLLNAPAHMKVILMAGTGEKERVDSSQQLIMKIFKRINPGDYCLRLASPYHATEMEAGTIRHFPLLDLLPGTDILIGSSGYNLFHESRALSIPSIFLPQERLYDDQHLRAGDLAVSTPESLEERLRSLIATAGGSGITGYTNMAEAAARYIAAQIEA